MSSILRVPDIGGYIIWLWKRYIKKDKNVKLDITVSLIESDMSIGKVDQYNLLML